MLGVCDDISAEPESWIKKKKNTLSVSKDGLSVISVSSTNQNVESKYVSARNARRTKGLCVCLSSLECFNRENKLRERERERER